MKYSYGNVPFCGLANMFRCNNVLWISENVPYDSNRMQED